MSNQTVVHATKCKNAKQSGIVEVKSNIFSCLLFLTYYEKRTCSHFYGCGVGLANFFLYILVYQNGGEICIPNDHNITK
jgi:hypothetical protein